jgi:hypothetical protein
MFYTIFLIMVVYLEVIYEYKDIFVLIFDGEGAAGRTRWRGGGEKEKLKYNHF